MLVLAVNSGSSSLKVKLVRVAEPGGGRQREAVEVLGQGAVEAIGGEATLYLRAPGGSVKEAKQRANSHGEAIRWVLESLKDFDPDVGKPPAIDAVGHRVVHGGSRFQTPVEIDAAVLAEIERLSDLAPLHNPACLAGIRGAQAWFGEDTPMVAVFDTAFHRTLPPRAATYAIPPDLAEKHAVQRYGFHGIAHASMAAIYAATTGRAFEEIRLITLHLGNGCSATAIDRGRSVDTSMGFTPLEGLVMGTRSGDVDPAIVSYLARREDRPADEIIRWLNERSGLLGLSGLTHDMRQLLAAEQAGDGRAEQAGRAIELFCYRVRKYLGAYLAVLGGADAVVFGGGIGERAPAIRARICDGMAWCGLTLDPKRNEEAVGVPAGEAVRISPEEAALAAYVAAVDEETEIARETARCLRAGTK